MYEEIMTQLRPLETETTTPIGERAKKLVCSKGEAYSK